MTYATDADLQTRVPLTAALTSAQRTIALDDAEAEINDSAYGLSTVRAHTMLAAHYLAKDGLITGGSGGSGAVTARSIGGLSVTYASGSTSSTGPHSSTSYGQCFDEITDRVGHGMETDAP